MKIALLTYSFPPETGGVENLLFALFSRLARKHDVFVLTPVLHEEQLQDSIQRVNIPNRNAWYFWQMLRKINPDRVVVGHTHPQLLMAALLFSRRVGAIAHGNDYLVAQKRWHAPFFNGLLKQTNPLITTTQENKRRLTALTGNTPIIIPPATDPTKFFPAAHLKTKQLTLLTVSRLVPRKGIDLVLETLPILCQQFPNLRYHIAGSGPDRPRLERIVADLKIGDTVRFLGRVPDEQLPATYQQADIFVMPVREIKETASVEGFGIVYLEASASGLPIVVGRSGGAVEAVKDGETGLIVPPDDVVTLQETLARLLASPSLRQQLGERGRKWVETEMNWEQAYQKLSQALDIN